MKGNIFSVARFQALRNGWLLGCLHFEELVPASRVGNNRFVVKYLVNSNVLIDPTKPYPNPGVVKWLRRKEREVAANPVILDELEYGILLLPGGMKRRKLAYWFSEGLDCFTSLDFDAVTGITWARLLAALKQNGLATPEST